jgi:hypothetical protein
VWISAFTPGAGEPRLRDVLYLAEFYQPASAIPADVTARARAGAEQAARAGVDVGFVQAIFVPQDETCFALYRACSAGDVSAAGQQAGLAFDRIVAAVSIP